MDEADMSQARMEHEEVLRARYTKPFELADGVAGDCDLCGEWSGRLVGGVCAPCRDKHKLP
jgi:hypothetical protein